jgi:hypothetical protein
VNGVNPARANQDEKDELSRVTEHIFSKIADEFETKAAFGAPTHRSLLCEARPECRAPSL